MRMEPTRSDPYSRNVIPADNAAAVPPEEPPGVRVVSHGLLVTPKSSLVVCPKSPSMKATLVFPTMIAPASFKRRATVASQSATKSLKAGLPQVVCSPATLKLSLIVIGTPCSGPASSPWAVASSAAFASCKAASRRSSTTAFSAGLASSIRVSSISVSSREESSLRRSARAASVADPNTGVSFIFFAFRSTLDDRFLEFRDPRIPVRSDLDVKLPVVTNRAVAIHVDPAGQRLDGPHDVLHRAAVHDRGRLLDLGQDHDREIVVLTGIGVDRDGGVDEDPVAVRGVLVVGDVRAIWGQACTVEPAAQLVEERSDDRSDGLGLEARRRAGELRHPEARDSLDLNVVGRHRAFPLDDLESRFDLRQPGGVGSDPRL